jgi:hypothetical protein
VTDLDLTVPDAVLDSVPSLWQDQWYIVRGQTETISGITTPGADLRIGPYVGEFWEAGGDELAPEVAAARGRYRLAFAKSNSGVVESDQVEINGARIYDVAWAPDPSGLDLQRVIGLKD